MSECLCPKLSPPQPIWPRLMLSNDLLQGFLFRNLEDLADEGEMVIVFSARVHPCNEAQRW